MKRSSTSGLGVLVVIVAGFVAIQLWRGRPAGTPAFFEPGVTLRDALAASERSGRPVLAVATADWCGPCQGFKRGALSDTRVAEWIETHTEPVSIDATKPGNPDAAALGVRSVPTVILLRGGEELARHEGAMSASAMLDWGERVLASQGPGSNSP